MEFNQEVKIQRSEIVLVTVCFIQLHNTNGVQNINGNELKLFLLKHLIIKIEAGSETCDPFLKRCNSQLQSDSSS